MEFIELPLKLLKPAPWNPNIADDSTMSKLRKSLSRYGVVQNLVVRPIAAESFELLSGNQRLRVLRELNVTTVHCVVVDLDDANARLLVQALNRIHGDDDLGLRAEVIKEVLLSIPQTDVLSLLPETGQSLEALSTVGREDLASHLASWQRAQSARLNHMVLQLTDRQLATVENAIKRASTEQPKTSSVSNDRGYAISVVCQAYLDSLGAEG